MSSFINQSSGKPHHEGTKDTKDTAEYLTSLINHTLVFLFFCPCSFSLSFFCVGAVGSFLGPFVTFVTFVSFVVK
jgi:hypothetical protein